MSKHLEVRWRENCSLLYYIASEPLYLQLVRRAHCGFLCGRANTRCRGVGVDDPGVLHGANTCPGTQTLATRSAREA